MLKDEDKLNRSKTIKTTLISYLSLMFFIPLLGTQEASVQPIDKDTLSRTIIRAGNTTSEKERYKLLSELQKHGEISSEFKKELEILLPLVDWWANGREKYTELVESGRAAEDGYLNRFFYPEGRLDRNGEFPPIIEETSKLFPLWAFYKARILIWLPIQVGEIRMDVKKREEYFEPARQLLRIARNSFPDNRIIDMYLGKTTEWKTPFSPDPGAPKWANLQREGLEKLADLIHWWIKNRQLKDGQFGGGWGDDVEMWRWWSPILVGFQDPVIESGQRLLSESIFKQPHLKSGYTSKFSDVEHTAEDTADTITPMLFLSRNEEIWKNRTKRIVDLSLQEWMGKNQQGFSTLR